MGLFAPNVRKMKERKDLYGLLKALTHDNWKVRRDAARALGEICDPRSAKNLVPFALLDPKAEVRWVAADACVALGIPAVQVLIGILQDHIDWADLVDENAYAILRGHPDIHGLQDISFMAPKEKRHLFVAGEEGKETAERAKEILKRMRGTPVVESLTAMLQNRMSTSPETLLRRTVEASSRRLDIEYFTSQDFATIALGEIGDSRAMEALDAIAIEPGKPFPNYAVLEALSKIRASGDSHN